MREANHALLLSSSRREAIELSAFGRPLHLWHEQLRSLVLRRFGERHANLFAEPVVSRERIDWYCPVDAAAVRRASLPPTECARADATLAALLADLHAFAGELASWPGSEREAALLRLALQLSEAQQLFVAAEQPVLAGWGLETAANGARPAVRDAGQPVADGDDRPTLVVTPRRVADTASVAEPSGVAISQATPPPSASSSGATGVAARRRASAVALIAAGAAALLWMAVELRPGDEPGAGRLPAPGTQSIGDDDARLAELDDAPKGAAHDVSPAHPAPFEGTAGWLVGSWRARETLWEDLEGRPVEIALDIAAGGAGEVQIRRRGASACVGSVQVRAGAGGNAVIDDLAPIHCPDGTEFVRGAFECVSGDHGIAACSRTIDADQRIKLTLLRTVAVPGADGALATSSEDEKDIGSRR